MEQFLKPQQVWLAWFPFTDIPNDGKYRPVIVLDIDNENVQVLSVPVTSAQPRDKFDWTISDWSEIPLEHFSTARISLLKLLPLKNFKHYIGELSDDDWDKITSVVAEYITNN